MAKPIIAIKVRTTNYAALVNLGNRIIVSMTGNANFSTPAPTLLSVQTAITAVENAIAVWGSKGNRGSHASLSDLREKALTLSQMIKSLAQYVQNTAQTAAGSNYFAMAAIITTSGFSAANIKSPQGVLQKVQNFHNFVSRKLNANQVKLKWKKPLNTGTAGNVKSYTIYRVAQPSPFSIAMPIATTTKTSYIDIPSLSSDNLKWSYWIVPTGAAGNGVVSDAVNVTVSNI